MLFDSIRDGNGMSRRGADGAEQGVLEGVRRRGAGVGGVHGRGAHAARRAPRASAAPGPHAPHHHRLAAQRHGTTTPPHHHTTTPPLILHYILL